MTRRTLNLPFNRNAGQCPHYRGVDRERGTP